MHRLWAGEGHSIDPPPTLNEPWGETFCGVFRVTLQCGRILAIHQYIFIY
jgi:hypothetical protein